MRWRILALAVASLVLCRPSSAATDPSTVLILVNDLVPPEPGTGPTGASIYVGEYYASRRGIPFSNIVHLSVPLACCSNDPRHWDSWNVNWEKFETYVRTPVKSFLESNGMKTRIKYIVPTYGIPVRTTTPNYPKGLQPDFLSIDSFLAAIYSGSDAPFRRNPYALSRPEYSKDRFADWQNPQGWPMYLVTRLDGPGAAIAAGLVDKAILAESTLTRNDGIGYFDYQGNHNYPVTDFTMLNAYNLAVQRGFRAVLNDQSLTSGQMIHSAPQALWAWGWYSGLSDWDGYEFVNGAVGAQLTSYTANNTATWGATGEPYTSGYANGDNLLQHFWNGYNFGESAYLASPVLNWMMVFVGDPLYTPQIFQRPPAPPEATPSLTFSAQQNGDTYTGPLTLSAEVPQGVAGVQFQANGYDVGRELTEPPFAATFETTKDDNGPWLLTVKTIDFSGNTLVSDPVPIILFNDDAPKPAPSPISVTPSSGSGSTQQFTFTFSAVSNPVSMNMLVHSSLTAGGGCYLIYQPWNNEFDLVDDAGTGLLPITPGSPETLANGQCTIPGSSVSVASTSNSITIIATVTFTSAFTGPKTIWATWYGGSGQQTQWLNIGTWTVP
jgi:uncharacterized protein (TIGR03790 family)